MDMDRYSAPLRVVLNIATLKAYVIHNWAKSEFDLMQMPWRNLGSSEIGFCDSPACRGNHGMVEMRHLAGSITFDYKGSRDIQIYHQRAALL